MPEMTAHKPGTPCWVDLGSPDLDASIEFYGGLFGWDVPEAENAEQTGGYRQAMDGGRPVAGLMPLMQEGQQPAWSTYISVEDADAVAASVREAGGSVLAEPMDVMDLGRMAVFADSEGAVFGVWQPGSFAGAGVVREPNAMAWNELTTRDPDAARAFYGDVFGWGFEDKEFDRGNYTILQVAGEGFGGVTDRIPDGVPAHWLVYFAVADADAAVSTATEGGGKASVGPFDIGGVGRIAVIQDPWRATFAVIQPNPSEG